MVALAQDLPGLIGARLTGGGFGGCTMNLVEQEQGRPLPKNWAAAMLPKPASSRDSRLPRFGRSAPAGVLASSFERNPSSLEIKNRQES